MGIRADNFTAFPLKHSVEQPALQFALIGGSEIQHTLNKT
jgi:hypothetical protein